MIANPIGAIVVEYDTLRESLNHALRTLTPSDRERAIVIENVMADVVYRAQMSASRQGVSAALAEAVLK